MRGYDRGLNFKKLGLEIAKSNIRTFITFPGTTGENIWKAIATALPPRQRKIRKFSTLLMADAVKIAYQETPGGKIVLMSPASPSFGMFRDYRERGNLFKKYVREFGQR